MCQNNCNTKREKGRHLSYEDRVKIEHLYNQQDKRESHHLVLEKDSYSINDAYKKSANMNYYNNRYRHGCLNDMPPARFYEMAKAEKIVVEPVLA
ncbi:hypothetical protein SAMN02745118_00081 [Selenihalanaerobacter shriftii]|uniref:Uncharacterized protein n=1 Tax=Selenihalanaerobacter shriftii TaxID=142842 RepID=A0A1T4JKF5_9FIRM|nr:hypothetical protein SAMN02745118_00081 [Selenihalanaerobacter shriftii]